MAALDIAVAGCGPCGLAAALLLHRAGHQVSLFERFDTPRPIGSGLMLQPTGMAVLARLGLLDASLKAGSRIDNLLGMQGNRVVLDVRYAALRNQNAFGVGIARSSLFDILYAAVQNEGIAIYSGHAVTGSMMVGNKRALHFAERAPCRPFDLVVDALGTRTPLAPQCGRDLAFGALWASLDWPENSGFDERALQQRYRRANIMAGVMPIGVAPGSSGRKAAFFWSLRADRLENWRREGLAVWKKEVLALWPRCAPLLDQISDVDQLTFAYYAHRTLRSPAEPALIHLGDAWHSASPQLGQGANMALLDAWALAKGLGCGSNVEEGIALAIAMRRRHVSLYQWFTAMFTPVYQSESRLLPFLRNHVVGPLSRIWPANIIQALLVSGLVGKPLAALDLNIATFDAQGPIPATPPPDSPPPRPPYR